MSESATWTEVSDPETLTALLGEPTPAVRDKVRTELTDVDVAWLRASPFCILATTSADGACDASPKGDPAGQLVHVIDERTIALAERTAPQIKAPRKEVGRASCRERV